MAATRKTPEQIAEEARKFQAQQGMGGAQAPEEQGAEEGDLYLDYVAPVTGGIRAALAKGGRGLIQNIMQRKRKLTPEEQARSEAARIRDEGRIQKSYDEGGRMSNYVSGTPQARKIDWQRIRAGKPD